MSSRSVWTGGALFAAVAIYMLGDTGRSPWFSWFYGSGYFLLGVILLGTVARWWRRGSPVLWRPAMLSIGALCAAIEAGLRGQSVLAGAAVDRWMVALLGLLVAAIAARFMPFRLSRLWFGLDRRGHEPGA